MPEAMALSCYLHEIGVLSLVAMHERFVGDKKIKIQ
jgi:hypothetical protein